MSTEHTTQIWDVVAFVVSVVGVISTIIAIIAFIALVWAWLKGIIKPLWRLGLGLSKRRVLIAGSQDDYVSIKRLLEKCNLFAGTIMPIFNESDMEMVYEADLIVYRYRDTESLKRILDRRSQGAPLVVYAQNWEIKDQETWKLLDQHTNTTVCNLKGRLINDLLVGLMTNAYVR